jgi:N utilization substance protein B
MSRKTPSLGDRRRAARVAAVQALYQMALNGGTAEDIVAEFVAFRLREDDSVQDGEVVADVALFTDLVLGAAARTELSDRLIEAALDKDRKVKRLEILMQSILRAGVYELSARDDIDTALTISEYVAVADAFFNEREPALVNAVLDRVARTIAAGGISAEPAHGATQDG